MHKFPHLVGIARVSMGTENKNTVICLTVRWRLPGHFSGYHQRTFREPQDGLPLGSGLPLSLPYQNGFKGEFSTLPCFSWGCWRRRCRSPTLCSPPLCCSSNGVMCGSSLASSYKQQPRLSAKVYAPDHSTVTLSGPNQPLQALRVDWDHFQWWPTLSSWEKSLSASNDSSLCQTYVGCRYYPRPQSPRPWPTDASRKLYHIARLPQ